MKTRSTRLALSVCLLGSLLTIVLGASTARAQATATSLGNCATSGAPSLFPFGAYDPVVFSTNFTGSSVPSSWWVARYATTFNQYTIHDPGNVIFGSAGMQLTNSPDPNGKQQDMGIAGESPILATSGEMPNGYQGDNMLMAWCARVTSDRDIDTDFELGQASSRPWPPEIDLAEGAGSTLTVILHWTCDSSITGCPRTDGDFNGTVAPSGGYSPWPPPGVKVGDHYTCDEITNGSGQQVYNNPSDGHFDYNCRAEVNLPLPKGVSVTAWNQYGAEFNPVDNRFSVWIDGQPPVTITDGVCGSHLLYDDNGLLPIGQIENGRSSEPCLQDGGNWQWDVQQTEWLGRKTVAGLTKGEYDTGDVAWFGDYSYESCLRVAGDPDVVGCRTHSR
jgi:hypothetical protein